MTYHMPKRGWRSAIVALTLLQLPQTHADGLDVPQNDLLNAVLWTQSSVEFKANALGSFRLARFQLDRALADAGWTAVLEQSGDYQSKPPAVILDVDETVLDNSEYEAWLVMEDEQYSGDTWAPYVDEAISRPVPGSLEFIEYAVSKGVEIIYLSNRKAPREEATRGNLKAFGFPVSENGDTVILRGEREAWKSSKKSPRRQHVADQYRVLMIIGDNLGDFTDEYKGGIDDRERIYEQYFDMWGSKWIMIGNPMYGSWEAAPFKGDYSLSIEERRLRKREALRAWKPR